jgi:hypothetical protein
MKIKHLILSAILFAGTAHSANEMAYTPNKAGGSIFFTYSNCVYVNNGQRVPDQYYVYSTDSAGNKGLDGCYYYKHPFYFVEWNSGGRLSVNVNTVTPLLNK